MVDVVGELADCDGLAMDPLGREAVRVEGIEDGLEVTVGGLLVGEECVEGGYTLVQ